MDKKNIKNKIKRIREEGINAELLEKYFNIDKIKEDNIVESTINTIWDKIEDYTDILEDIVNPEGDPILLFEIEGLNQEEKQLAWKILKELMKLKREKEIAELENKKEKKIKSINETLKEWNNQVEYIKSILQKMAENWDSVKDKENKMNYLG